MEPPADYSLAWPTLDLQRRFKARLVLFCAVVLFWLAVQKSLDFSFHQL